MRTKEEIQLAILTIRNELTNAPANNFFGDDNHKALSLSIELLEGKIDMDDVYDMESNEEITDGEFSIVDGYNLWMKGEGDELIDLLFKEESLVTELSPKTEINMCSKTCGECPFSNKSLPGWLASYKVEDLNDFMNAEISFPCHKTMTDGDLSPFETTAKIQSGEMKMCRGYVESVIKSCKSPRHNKQLIDAIKTVKEQGLSENTMSMIDFMKHHKKYSK